MLRTAMNCPADSSTLGDPSKPYLSQPGSVLTQWPWCLITMWGYTIAIYPIQWGLPVPQSMTCLRGTQTNSDPKSQFLNDTGAWVAPHFAQWGTTQYLRLMPCLSMSMVCQKLALDEVWVKLARLSTLEIGDKLCNIVKRKFSSLAESSDTLHHATEIS